MNKRLTHNLTSAYIEAANRLNSKRSRKRIVAYVESYDDVFFWRAVLTRFEDDTRYFEVMLPSRSDRLERGKKAAIMRMIAGQGGRDMIACVDADYDYLIQGATQTSDIVIHNPYVFHTYAYAIENMQCYAPSLHAVCVAVTLNDHAVFDFCSFMACFSRIIYPLFVWNIWYYRSSHYAEFTMSDFLQSISTGKLSPANADDILARLSHRVEHKVAALRRQHPEAKAELRDLSAQLATLGVSPDDTYLYIQGHHLYDQVVMPLMKSVCARLVREREREITQQSMHSTQRRNELSCYTNSVGDINASVRKNVGFIASAPYRHIVDDLQRYVDSLATDAGSGHAKA